MSENSSENLSKTTSSLDQAELDRLFEENRVVNEDVVVRGSSQASNSIEKKEIEQKKLDKKIEDLGLNKLVLNQEEINKLFLGETEK
jgi:hypothetical protein